jgi:phage gp16-like protein
MTPEDRRKTLAKIHIAKKDLGLDDDTYRAMLLELTGKSSSKDLTDQQLGKLMHHLKKRGFKPKAPVGSGSQRRQANDPESTKIRALWLFLYEIGLVNNPSEAALAAYVKRQTGVDDLHWLNSLQCERVIESLKKWAMRILKERVNALWKALCATGFRTIRPAQHAYEKAIKSQGYDAWHDAYIAIVHQLRRFGVRLDEAIAPRLQAPAPVGSAKNEPVQGVR